MKKEKCVFLLTAVFAAAMFLSFMSCNGNIEKRVSTLEKKQQKDSLKIATIQFEQNVIAETVDTLRNQIGRYEKINKAEHKKFRSDLSATQKLMKEKLSKDEFDKYMKNFETNSKSKENDLVIQQNQSFDRLSDVDLSEFKNKDNSLKKETVNVALKKTENQKAVETKPTNVSNSKPLFLVVFKDAHRDDVSNLLKDFEYQSIFGYEPGTSGKTIKNNHPKGPKRQREIYIQWSLDTGNGKSDIKMSNSPNEIKEIAYKSFGKIEDLGFRASGIILTTPSKYMSDIKYAEKFFEGIKAYNHHIEIIDPNFTKKNIAQAAAEKYGVKYASVDFYITKETSGADTEKLLLQAANHAKRNGTVVIIIEPNKPILNALKGFTKDNIQKIRFCNGNKYFKELYNYNSAEEEHTIRSYERFTAQK